MHTHGAGGMGQGGGGGNDAPWAHALSSKRLSEKVHNTANLKVPTQHAARAPPVQGRCVRAVALTATGTLRGSRPTYPVWTWGPGA
jgi:hypothetical protein